MSETVAQYAPGRTRMTKVGTHRVEANDRDGPVVAVRLQRRFSEAA
jgi:hypothetical protein